MLQEIIERITALENAVFDTDTFTLNTAEQNGGIPQSPE
jgi:hypothetical protein